ncbi:hypothetical protein [Microbacterium memoriense]|uniref:Leucyl-tRNA synthetase n=1 Tax=Microbacterium memoriense TaxID=2978350 RepID=A0ABT2PE51_9MICO|nr:hypothetical protein [Microbacterium memoriense]MCT9002084.1 hypothetical protein [Microbacterium memoriense]
MDRTVDILFEIFTWVGFGGFLTLGVVAVIVWAADGTWMPAEAIVDRDSGEPILRWFDADGDANSAVPASSDHAAVASRATVPIWYRHGWRDRMRLTPRPPALRAAVIGAVAMLALAIVSFVAGWIVLAAAS